MSSNPAYLPALATLLGTLLGTALTVNLPCQQDLVPITSSRTNKSDPEISPDGQQVAFKIGLGKIGLVSVASRFESTLVTSTQQDLFDFVWAPNSAGIYYLQGNFVRFIPRGGGNPAILATLQGTEFNLFCVDSADTTLLGTRRDGAMHHVFSLDTSGGMAPVDVVSSPNVLDDVRLDPSDSFILYRSWSGLPFSPNEYHRADLNGQNQALVISAPPQAQSATWVDNGQTVAMTVLHPVNFGFALARVGSSGVLELLTDGKNLERRSTLSADGQWLLFEAGNLGTGGISPAVMPAAGGGEVMLSIGQNLILNSGALTGGLSMDDSNSLVAFSGNLADDAFDSDQIYVVSLNREIRIFPRAETGKSIFVELPAEQNELGAVAFSFGVDTANPLVVPGFAGALQLQAGMAVVMGGVGDGVDPLSAEIPVPPVPALVGVNIFFQGARVKNQIQSEFTNWGWFGIF